MNLASISLTGVTKTYAVTGIDVRVILVRYQGT